MYDCRSLWYHGINFHDVQKAGWEDVVQDMPPHCSMAKFGLYVGKSISITQYQKAEVFSNILHNHEGVLIHCVFVCILHV